MTIAIVSAIAIVLVVVLVIACRIKAKKEGFVAEAINPWEEDEVPEEHVITTEEPVATLEKATLETVCEDKQTTKVVVDNTEKATKKERKPRKTQLERAEEAIAKLEGQISRRTELLKKLKKPVTKDERLTKWKAQLKELKSARTELKKATKAKKA